MVKSELLFQPDQITEDNQIAKTQTVCTAWLEIQREYADLPEYKREWISFLKDCLSHGDIPNDLDELDEWRQSKPPHLRDTPTHVNRDMDFEQKLENLRASKEDNPWS